MEDIKPVRVNYISDRRTAWLTSHVAAPTYHRELRTGVGGVGRVAVGRRGGGQEVLRQSKRKLQKEGGILPPPVTGAEVSVPNDVTTLICWRLVVEGVFNQSV